MKIFKYELLTNFNGSQAIEMPQGAIVLTVQVQRNQPVLWAMVNPDAPKVRRRFWMFPTGDDGEMLGKDYVGTVQLDRGDFVIHVFTDRAEY
jgi:hypothetical protein